MYVCMHICSRSHLNAGLIEAYYILVAPSFWHWIDGASGSYSFSTQGIHTGWRWETGSSFVFSWELVVYGFGSLTMALHWKISGYVCMYIYVYLSMVMSRHIWLMTVRIHGDFIVLFHWETKLLPPWHRYAPQLSKLLFDRYILATSKVISWWVLNCDSAH